MITKRMSITMTFMVVVLMSALCVFLLQTGNVTRADISVNFSGVWRIVLIDREAAKDDAMLVFKDQQMTYHPGGGSAPIASQYSIKEDQLVLDDLKLSFAIQKISDSAIKMEGSDGRVWQTLKISDSPDMKVAEQINLEGNWDVLLHGSNPVSETMTVTGNQLTFFKPGSDTPYFTGNFVWESINHLYIASMNLRMVFYPVNESRCTMVEGDQGYCWEIVRHP